MSSEVAQSYCIYCGDEKLKPCTVRKEGTGKNARIVSCCANHQYLCRVIPIKKRIASVVTQLPLF